MPLGACKRESRELNESLRLTPDQIAHEERAADAGDAEAAKRLWQHYAGVEFDMKKGDLWRRRYESLISATPRTK